MLTKTQSLVEKEGVMGIVNEKVTVYDAQLPQDLYFQVHPAETCRSLPPTY